jgi:GMP synthase (glutamine-hydrolysing)
MQFLIVDGWTRDGNADHFGAGCETQAEVFAELVKETLPEATTTIVDTQTPGATAHLDLKQFQAAIWTGGGGNIYEKNDFNRDQLTLCERVLDDVPFLWGSCWGLQVIVTVLGGLVVKAPAPEIGIASDIVIKDSDNEQMLYRAKPTRFDAPTHHGDEIARLPGGFEILAENNVTLQAVVADGGKIYCTQYHPELPYDYIKKLLTFWAPNYRELFSEQEFQTLLVALTEKEPREKSLRKIEFNNWLVSISDAPLAASR